jgi:hypothetical protein
MGWLSQWSMRRAARTYARRLPVELRAGWGAAQFYTPDQVATVIRRLRLEGPHTALAYAAFATEADFAAIGATEIGYEEARNLMARAAPGVLSATYRQDSMSNSDAANRYGIGV